MRLCSNCNSPVDENIKFCPMCGAALDAEQATKAKVSENKEPVSDVQEGDYDYQKDVEVNRGIAIFSYLSFLFIVPMLAAKDSKFARFHAMQGAVLFVASGILLIAVAVMRIVLSIVIPYILIYRLFILVNLLVSGVIITFSVLGIVNVANGKMQKLPLIGEII